MKCPIDQTEMEQGYLRMDGTLFQRFITWVTGQVGSFRGLNFKGVVAIAWKCPKCEKIELTSEVKEEK